MSIELSEYFAKNWKVKWIVNNRDVIKRLIISHLITSLKSCQ